MYLYQYSASQHCLNAYRITVDSHREISLVGIFFRKSPVRPEFFYGLVIVNRCHYCNISSLLSIILCAWVSDRQSHKNSLYEAQYISWNRSWAYFFCCSWCDALLLARREKEIAEALVTKAFLQSHMFSREVTNGSEESSSPLSILSWSSKHGSLELSSLKCCLWDKECPETPQLWHWERWPSSLQPPHFAPPCSNAVEPDLYFISINGACKDQSSGNLVPFNSAALTPQRWNNCHLYVAVSRWKKIPGRVLLLTGIFWRKCLNERVLSLAQRVNLWLEYLFSNLFYLNDWPSLCSLWKLKVKATETFYIRWPSLSEWTKVLHFKAKGLLCYLFLFFLCSFNRLSIMHL